MKTLAKISIFIGFIMSFLTINALDNTPDLAISSVLWIIIIGVVMVLGGVVYLNVYD